MLAARPSPIAVSESELDLAARLLETDGGIAESPSYALIARILKEDRAVTADSDLSALQAHLARQDNVASNCHDIAVRIVRDSHGSAGFAFDCSSLKITSVKQERRDLASMRIGDVIVAVNNRTVETSREYHRVAKGIRDFRLTLRRSGAAEPPVQARARPNRAEHRARGPSEAERQAMMLDVDNMSYEELLALDVVQAPVKQTGLPDAIIEQIPVEYICGGGGESECAICLEEFYDGEGAMRFPCTHMFHSTCMQEWLRRQSRCPCCNLELTEAVDAHHR